MGICGPIRGQLENHPTPYSERNCTYQHQLLAIRVVSVQAVLRGDDPRLLAASTRTEMIRLLALLGQFGEPTDAELAERFVDHSDDLIANVACEVMLRLRDPLAVAENWREL